MQLCSICICLTCAQQLDVGVIKLLNRLKLSILQSVHTFKRVYYTNPTDHQCWIHFHFGLRVWQCVPGCTTVNCSAYWRSVGNDIIFDFYVSLTRRDRVF
ncbi:unnamed protein product [Haemonchus placei]|uniref:Uncharacterized protein n=1 Tax=Haemonchus placei TaxID=6290 RepID=A0A3P7WTE5_HAEPC|nr:unnamed protein product [Haemonchus placei]